jgi:membrane fusion protein, multidrug efflux system
MFARVLAIFSTDDNALMIPEEAILPQGGRQFVVRLATAEGGEAAPPVSQPGEVTLGVRRDGQVQ